MSSCLCIIRFLHFFIYTWYIHFLHFCSCVFCYRVGTAFSCPVSARHHRRSKSGDRSQALRVEIRVLHCHRMVPLPLQPRSSLRRPQTALPPQGSPYNLHCGGVRWECVVKRHIYDVYIRGLGIGFRGVECSELICLAGSIAMIFPFEG